MNKRNLYNLWRLRIPSTDSRTFFQQKWTARSLLRGYHGEHISETKWTRLFDRRLASVVDLSPRYLAEHDGSEQAAGRGSGRDDGQTPTANAFASGTGDKKGRGPQITPYMAMTFAPMERRLDIAVFRALFASSARQARQMIVHGRVKVNGQKACRYLTFSSALFDKGPPLTLCSATR